MKKPHISIALVAAILSGCISSEGVTNSAVSTHATVGRLAAIERHIGLHERKNRSRIRNIIGVDPVKTPWCGAAAAYAVKEAGGTPPRGYLRAYNWSRWGSHVPLSQARRNDVVVVRNRRGHHVAVYKGRAKSGIVLCGGNMSNRFKCSTYRISSVVAVRR